MSGEMRETTARVVSQRAAAEGIYELVIETGLAADARPGQFINLYCGDSARLLPRPISICDALADEGRMRLVYRVVGAGTAELSALTEGSAVRVMGNLGNGYDLAAAVGKRVLVVGGGLGIPPMLYLARALRASAGEDAPASVTAVLGYRSAETFLLEDFCRSGEVLLASDDGAVGAKGTVLDAMCASGAEADVIYACGPLPMLRALAAYSASRRAKGNDNICYVSLEERMACGVGACLGCVVRTVGTDAHSRVRNARICAEGPVFDSGRIDWEAMG